MIFLRTIEGEVHGICLESKLKKHFGIPIHTSALKHTFHIPLKMDGYLETFTDLEIFPRQKPRRKYTHKTDCLWISKENRRRREREDEEKTRERKENDKDKQSTKHKRK